MFGLLAWGWIVNLVEGDLPHELSTPIEWLPSGLPLVASLAVFLVVWHSRLSPLAHPDGYALGGRDLRLSGPGGGAGPE